MTVELDYSAFDLDGTDRDFVTKLVDLFQSYDAKASTTARSAAGGTRKARGDRSKRPTSEDPDPATAT